MQSRVRPADVVVGQERGSPSGAFVTRSLGRGNQPHELNAFDQQLASFEGKSGIFMAVHPVGFLCDPEVR